MYSNRYSTYEWKYFTIEQTYVDYTYIYTYNTTLRVTTNYYSLKFTKIRTLVPYVNHYSLH